MRKKTSVLLLMLLVAVCFLSPINAIATIENKTISLMGIIDDDGGDRTSWIAPSAISVGANIGNTSVSKYYGFTVSDFMSQIDNQDMVVIHTHGNQSAILSKKDDTEILITSAMVDVPLAQTALSQLRICFIGACSCGAGGANADNFINRVYEQGALCVIGYQQSVKTDCNRTMLKQFCYYIGQGYTVNNALIRAEQDVFNTFGEFGETDDRLVRGISSIAMTDSSYRVIGTSTYSLRNYESQSVDIDSNEVFFKDESSLCTTAGDMFLYDENNKIISYAKLDMGNDIDSCYASSLNLDDFFDSFNLDGYRLEENKNSTSKMICMRSYINDIKTNDIVYYTINESGELLTYGYPRIGNANEVKKIYFNVNKDLIMDYINEKYNNLDIIDIIIDVDNVLEPYVRISYKDIASGCECIETLVISINEIMK